MEEIDIRKLVKELEWIKSTTTEDITISRINIILELLKPLIEKEDK